MNSTKYFSQIIFLFDEKDVKLFKEKFDAVIIGEEEFDGKTATAVGINRQLTKDEIDAVSNNILLSNTITF